MQKEIKILKVRFNNVTLQEALAKALQFSDSQEQHYICTPNPEIVLSAQENHKFLSILNRSSLNIPDGTGILWAAKRQKTPLQARVTGVDLMKEICKNSDKRIFLLGAQEGIAKQAAKKLKTNIVGTHSGSPQAKDEQEIIEKINRLKPTILFVAYGAPAQELWIARNLKKIPSVKLAMGVGGSFDFIAGKAKRAPKWMQKLSIEWFYRLLKEPKRIGRIYNATIKFPITFIKKS